MMDDFYDDRRAIAMIVLVVVAAMGGGSVQRDDEENEYPYLSFVLSYRFILYVINKTISLVGHWLLI